VGGQQPTGQAASNGGRAGGPARHADAAALASAIADELSAWIDEDGRSAVLVPPALREPLGRHLEHALPSGVLGAGDAALDTRVSLLTVAQAKGLEFDQIVVVEPATLLEASPRGAHDLYVALTRATSQLVVVHSRPLPAGFPD
jgi:superfamily I DNA/RNA helicase